MKKVLTLLLSLLMLLSLCACNPQTQTEPTEPTKVEQPSQNPVEIAKSYIDKPIEELYAVIGQPLSSDYASSCLGPGEDGLLEYDGFVVYTYRENGKETVYDVE